ncbi:nucleoside deaminase [Tannockella kyphosi]|uniref:nucleoside deaminase n=1 Tax=Tannockella kyphosi TaxID=2899121 RepID=UPI002012A035|nr:nucleoside deaminase [Tannockella kyphosi]
MEQDEKYMLEAYKQAKKALKQDDVPVGAIIVKNNKIIARAYNQREYKQSVTAHAEVLAIQKACKKLNTWRLDDCILYSTMEPCIMCSGVIIQSRISKVVYGAHDTRWASLNKISSLEESLNHMPIIVGGILEESCSKLVKEYFKQKR